jgi:beta-glucuronidase
MREMLDNAMNHASIAIWAFFNEGPSQSLSACDAYRMNTDIIKSRDNSRLVSYASDRPPPGDKCFHDVVDIMAMNGYPAWYNHNANPTKYWSNIASYYKAVGKPFLISESGAGGIYEWANNDTAARWTCLYQNQVLSEDVEVALSDPNISGVALWHFFDFKVNDAFENNTHCDFLPSVYPPTCGYIDEKSTRPGGANHKGVVDFWRRKKSSFEEVAKRFLNVTKNKRTSFVETKNVE